MSKKKKKTSLKNQINAMQRRPMVSLCTIVKNEEKFIAQCLQSVAGVVDEIVLVDTGSTDRTVEIAENMGAKVYHHAWQDSFSEARNYALQFATCDWILHLDADEELDKKDQKLLRRTLETTKSDSIFVPILNYLPDGVISKFYYRRLFRREKGHYQGIVHNQIVVDGSYSYAEIRIHHYGYNLAPEKMEAKYKRSSMLLLKAIENDPNDVFSRFNLARIYRNQAKYQKCIEEGTAALALNPFKSKPSTYFMLLFDVAYSHMMMDNNDRAIRLCEEGLSKHPENIDLLFTLAGAFAKRGDLEQAIEKYQRYLEVVRQMKASPSFNLTTIIVDSWTFENKALNNIGQCLADMGKYTEAESLLQKALQQNKKEVSFYKGLSFCYLKQNDFQNAKRMLVEAIEQSIADDFIYFKLGEIYREEGNYKEALKYYQKAVEIGGEKADVLNARANVYLQMNDLRQAKEQFSSALELQDSHVGALFNLFCISNMTDDQIMFDKTKNRLLSVRVNDSSIYMQAAKFCIERQNYNSAIEFYEKYLKSRPEDFVALSNLAGCYAKMGHFDSAQMGYQAAIVLNPQYDIARRNLELLQNRKTRVAI